ncbi:hypothetical protein H2198_003520 [Neophaeococcomyces mojaviensis]|uniref:Uncharacterized protein n=1 Tax=Neophaeococcomyces mojaviensis TaxID=3383035 RepID=A0ACC3AB84_9EURO|nr:hypothetical protein H2198_003520 [Knufia sp. JES_112]
MLQPRASSARTKAVLQNTIRSTTNLSTSQHDLTCRLPDGRTLGYAEYGHLSGFPPIFFHGFPSSRLEASGFERIARRRKLRIISPDRPGFGLSTIQPNRRILDWPSDVEALTAHLGLSRFAVLGGSGGGPYALACAYSLPKEIMSAVGLMASAGPWDAGVKDIPWSGWFTYLAATYVPGGFRIVTDGLLGALRWIVRTEMVTRRLDKWLEGIQKKEEERGDITTEDRRNKLLKMLFEGFAQGSAGFVLEAQLLSQPWGFRFEDVGHDNVRIWHGVKDTRAPIGHVRYMAERLPHCELKEFDEGHFTMVEHLEEILDGLVPEGADNGEHTGAEWSLPNHRSV